MRKTREILSAGLVAVILAACFISTAPAFAGGRGRVDVRRSYGPAFLGPWVDEAWPDWSYGAGQAQPGWDAYGAYVASEPFYPWGYTAPDVQVGFLCVANQFTTSLSGVTQRFQRVRPAYYCDP